MKANIFIASLPNFRYDTNIVPLTMKHIQSHLESDYFSKFETHLNLTNRAF